MKANELTYGDWVFIPKVAEHRLDRHVKVKGIGEDVILFNTESGYDNVSLERVHPIPLTAEILEKNGFRYEQMYGSFYRSILGDYAIDREPTISIGWNGRGEMCEWDISDGKRGASYGKHLLGVHELQHALRLCGLNDLADNFKIE